MHIASVGIDLGKTTFHLAALGARGQVIVRKKFSRRQLMAYTANLPHSLIGCNLRFASRRLREGDFSLIIASRGASTLGSGQIVHDPV